MKKPKAKEYVLPKELRKARRSKELEADKCPWVLMCNGRIIETFDSHTKAKRALHYKMESIKGEWCDEWYEIKPKEK